MKTILQLGGIPQSLVLKALVNGAKGPVPISPMSDLCATNLTQRFTTFNTVHSKTLNIKFYGDIVDATGYDKLYGKGQAQQALDNAKKEFAMLTKKGTAVENSEHTSLSFFQLHRENRYNREPLSRDLEYPQGSAKKGAGIFSYGFSRDLDL